MKTYGTVENIEEAILNRLTISVSGLLSKRILLDDIYFDQFAHVIKDQIEYQARFFIYGQELGFYTFRYPKGWFQAFKKQFFPYFILKRFPVVYKEVRIEIKALFPDFNPPEDMGEVVMKPTII